MVNVRAAGAKDDDEDDAVDMKIQKLMPYQTYDAVRQQRITTFYLNDQIMAPNLYTDMIHKIRVAQPQDIIYIHLNTPGGRLDTGVQIINAMKDSAARIVAVLDSKAHSLGTLIFLAADEFIVHDNCMFMIHNYSSATFGKGNEQRSELEATLAWFKKLAQKYYTPFLSIAELDKILNGADHWMDSDEVKRRLNGMVKAQAKAAELAAKAGKPVRKVKAKVPEVLENGELPASSTVETTGKQSTTKTTTTTVTGPAAHKKAPMRVRSGFDEPGDVNL